MKVNMFKVIAKLVAEKEEIYINLLKQAKDSKEVLDSLIEYKANQESISAAEIAYNNATLYVEDFEREYCE